MEFRHFGCFTVAMLAIALAFAVFSCKSATANGGFAASIVPKTKVVSLAAAVSGIRAYEADSRTALAQSDVFDKLKLELEMKIENRYSTAGKIVSAAPTGYGNRVTNLAYNEESRDLTWTYVNNGDYDLSGEVSVADITPIAQNYLAVTDDGAGDDPYETWIDQSGDGEVGIPDITPIAANYLVNVASYAVVWSNNGSAPWTEIDRITLEDAIADLPVGQHFPIDFSFTLPAGEYPYVSVIPYDAASNSGDVCNAVATTGGESPRTLLIDFGSSYATTETPYGDWTTILRDATRSRFVDADGDPAHDGITENDGLGENEWAYYGISGATPINFQFGQRIVVTFYNNSDEYAYLETRISFVDSDRPDTADTDIIWYTMQNRLYHADTDWMPPRELVEMEYYISDIDTISAIDSTPSEGAHSLINISKPYSDTRFVLTRIELADGDTTPPTTPLNFTINESPMSPGNVAVRLAWSASQDLGDNATGVSRYLIYRDGELYDCVNEDDVAFQGDNHWYYDMCAEPATTYSYSVTALDAAPYGLYPQGTRLDTRVGNESAPAGPLGITTSSWSGDNVVNPFGDLTYAGAFRLPLDMDEYFTYASGGLAFYSQGNLSYNPETELPGSLFITTLLQREVAEISIPLPIVSSDADTLNRASIITAPANIWPSVYGGTDPTVPPGGTDFKVAGITYHPEANGVSERLYYTTCNFYGTDASAPVVGWMSLDLASSGGAWHVGGAPPSNTYPGLVGRFTFAASPTWAASVTDGRSLIVGNTFLSGGDIIMHGPSLYAVAPWESGALPANGEAISAVQLLEYSSGATLENRVVNFTRDEFGEGGAWITLSNGNSIAISFRRAVGDTWYGDSLGSLHSTWDIPEPPMGDKGVCATNWKCGLMLYNVEDITEVARGTLEPHEPQPYCYYDFSQFSLRPDGGTGQSGAIAWDDANRRLFYIEHNGDPGYDYGYSIIHVWDAG